MPICKACHVIVTDDILEHYRICLTLGEMFPTAPKRRKSKALCSVDGCRRPRCGKTHSARCKEHEANRRLMAERRRKKLSASRFRTND